MRRIIAVISAAAVILLCGACGYAELPGDTGDELPGDVDIVIEEGYTVGVPWIADEPMSPYKAAAELNLQTLELIYEGLFKISPDLSAEKELCSEWEMAANTWNITLKSGVMFHNGAEMKAADAAYSIMHAKQSGSSWAALLANVVSAEATGDYTLSVVTTVPDGGLCHRLIVPVIPEGSGEDENPAGTGAYKLVRRADEKRLEAFKLYRAGSNADIQTIDIVETDDTDEYIMLVEDHTITAAVSNHTSPGAVYFSGEYDKYTERSPIIHYFGINSKNEILADAAVRSALVPLIPRSVIAEECFGGEVEPTASPEPETAFGAYGMTSVSNSLDELGYTDTDGDGYRNLPGTRTANAEIEIVVNRDNMRKADACAILAERLEECGIKTRITKLGRTDFENALATGKYGMYYGEAELVSDLDFSALLYGGALGFGTAEAPGVADAAYAWKTSAPDMREAAWEKLIKAYSEEMPFYTVGYEMSTLLVDRGRFTHVQTGWNDPYCNILNWKITEGK